MLYNRVGRTQVELSAVGFGTCQLRLVPEAQALATLKRGFELGVNWVHVSPDYGGADELVARAIRESRRDVIAVSDGSGTMEHFERLFENACKLYGRTTLPLWGISCIDDQEFVGHDVWGPNGMVEFLLRQKRAGRIGAVYCTTHAPPDYVERLIESGCFDAVMLAYNPLGFHVLSSYAAAEGKLYEDIPANRERIFGLARRRGVGILVMKALAGGLLGKSKAFPPHALLADQRDEIRAHEVLRSILTREGVTAVVPGTASVAEAEENALAGHAPIELLPERARALELRVESLQKKLCSRCGDCEPTCSQGLPISWLFRDAYIWMNPADTFDAVGRLNYFHLHPEPTLACADCTNRTCLCPQGLDVPLELGRVHAAMSDLRARGLLPRTPLELEQDGVRGALAARVVYAEVADALSHGGGTCRFWLENAGARLWARDEQSVDHVALEVQSGLEVVQRVALREDVHPGNRTHLAFELAAGRIADPTRARFVLRTRDPSVEAELHRSAPPKAPEPRGNPMSSPLPDSGAPAPSSVLPMSPRRTHDVLHVAHDLPSSVPPGHVFAVRLTLENTGSLTWRNASPIDDHVGLAVHWDGVVVANHMLPRPEVAPGERVTLRFALEAPLQPGVHRLALKLVQYHVAVFEDRGAAPLVRDITVEDRPIERTAKLWSTMQRVDPWQYLPTRGIARAKSGEAFPVFAERAQGCHVWDTSGRRYIDYTMGWGTMLLGYAHPRVSAGLAAVLHTGSLVAWPQPIEIEVAEMLCEDFPSAEMVCFGKNGSDACTFAARMARIFTGKRTILFSGYHGWQDFWVEQVGFGRTGVAPREPALIHRFPFHDLEAFQRLYAEHQGDLAAVMIEPSPWAGDGLGFEPDTDAGFLRTIADATKRAGALFIMDEIVTGYRYPGHSVQKAKGVKPDLTCLGKAVAAGMPMSAIVGRADVFKSALPRTFFAATFHGEAYSFAAARAAIQVYREEPVAQHVWDYGLKLRDGVHALCRQLGVRAELKGPPFRMSFLFERSDPVRWQLERTLFQQELLRNGVTTYNGVMLPCYAHDDVALRSTLDAFGKSLEVVARAAERGNWDEVLEIPPLIDL